MAVFEKLFLDSLLFLKVFLILTTLRFISRYGEPCSWTFYVVMYICDIIHLNLNTYQCCVLSLTNV